MENIVTVGLSAALDTKVVVGGDEGEDLPLTNAHMHTCSWQIHNDINQKSVVPVPVQGAPIQIFVKNLTGRTISFEVSPSHKIEDIKRLIWEQEGINMNVQKLIYCGQVLQDNDTVTQSKIQKESTLHLIIRRRQCVKIDKESFDPRYDYTYPAAGAKENFQRGKRNFQRPLGWVKYAIKVLGKYGNDNWLGSNDKPGEWPVSYHGTDTMCAESMGSNVVELARGKNFKFGRGMYSVPNPDVAEKFSTPFDFEGRTYKMIFMNRLNPEYTREVQVPSIGDYFITSDESQIRAYAILVKKVDP